MQLVNNNI